MTKRVATVTIIIGARELRKMMKVGSGKFTYEEEKEWGHLPDGWTFHEVNGVAVNSQDRVYVFTRSEHPVIIFNRDGSFLSSWGEGQFTRPHSIFIGRDNLVYCVDDYGHAMRKFTMDGQLLMTIATAEHPSDTGYVRNRPETVLRSGPPFNRPTDVALSPEGDLYVSDGYGNARVHKFSPGGQLLLSWGEPGHGPGQFNIPHGVCVDRKGRVYIADRLNTRIQVFNPDGEFVDQWGDVHYPDAMCLDDEDNMYVVEQGGVFMNWPEVHIERWYARITVRDLNGRILSTWGEKDPRGQGRFFSPHGIAVDSHGDLYVGEIPVTYTHDTAPAGWPLLRKYVRTK